MAEYLERLTADMKSAMKSGDKPRLEVVRMLISDIKKKAEAASAELTADDEAAVLQKAVKSRADTVAQAKAAGRTEIATREQAEADLRKVRNPKASKPRKKAGWAKAKPKPTRPGKGQRPRKTRKSKRSFRRR